MMPPLSHGSSRREPECGCGKPIRNGAVACGGVVGRIGVVGRCRVATCGCAVLAKDVARTFRIVPALNLAHQRTPRAPCARQSVADKARPMRYLGAEPLPGRDGGTGRRSGLKIRRPLRSWGFDPPSRHKLTCLLSIVYEILRLPILCRVDVTSADRSALPLWHTLQCWSISVTVHGIYCPLSN